MLWSLKELNFEKKVKFISTTTTGVYGAPDFPIPEGYLKIKKLNYRFLLWEVLGITLPNLMIVIIFG